MTKALHRSIYTRDMELWRAVDAIVKLTDVSLSRVVEDSLRERVTKLVKGLDKDQLAQFELVMKGEADVTTVSR